MLGGAKPKELSYEGEESLVQMIKDNKVAGIYINGGYTAYVLAEGSTTTKDAFFKNPTKKATYFVRIPSRTEFAGKLDGLVEAGANVPVVKYDDPNSGSTWTSLLFPIGSLILMGIVVFFLFRQAGGANKQAMNFGKTKARLNMNVNVKFSDVAGAEEEKLELAEIVEFLKNPQKFTALGARIPKGVLLVGPPGTGKTLFAKAVAGESNVPFFSISGSDFVEMFVGTGAARVRDLFDQAKRNMPCIIFIDEIDAVGRHRGAGLGGGNDEREQTLNQLLVQMDGFEKNDGIIIMAATNRVDILDPALMRPGRFDRQIYVNTPDVKGREAIFKVHARNKPLASEISFKVLARMTSGFSGADIENLLNEASILAARADRKVIIMEDILEAINKVIAGPQKKSRIITDSDKRITAYHEAGHAIIAKVLPHCDEVQEVSIIPRGMAAGYTLTRPESDDSHVSKNKLTDLITMMLGGRAAEEIVIHDVSTGASNDIQRATSIARSMVTEWGMSDKVGNIFLGGEKEVFLGKDYATQHTYSEKIGDLIDSEIKKIIDDCYARAIEVLKSKRDILDNMVKVLYEKETIYTSEVEMLFEGKSAEEVIASIDARQEKNDKYKKTSAPKVEIVPETSKEQEQPTEDKIEDEAEDKEQITPTDEPKDND
ncbi:MAG: ATP-dependent zinc metalloprotease FtsH [Christensenellales bacterium]